MSSRQSLLVTGAVFLGLLGISVLGRVLPHPPNCTPIAAAALFAGFFFRSRLLATGVPLGAMLLTDWFWFGGYDSRIMITVYLALACPVLLRRFTTGRWQWLRILGCAVVSSLLFYLTTNFAVWACSGMYATNLTGLLTCYIAGLPFVKYTLAGDLLFSFSFFGLYQLAHQANQLQADHELLPAYQLAPSR